MNRFLNILYDLSTKRHASTFTAICMTLAGMYFSQSALVPILCGALFFFGWTVLKDGNVGRNKMLAYLSGMTLLLFLVCPIIQNRIDPPELYIYPPQNRSDDKHIIVRVTNIGKSNLPKDGTIIRLGLLSLKNGKPKWIEPNRLSQIQKNRQVAFRFQRPDSVPNFSIFLVQNKKLRGGYILEPFYLFRNSQGTLVWGSYYENIGFVDDNDANALDEILKNLETCFDSNKSVNSYSKCL